MIRIAALSLVLLAPSPLFAQCEVTYPAEYSDVDRLAVHDFLPWTSDDVPGGLRERLLLADGKGSAFDGSILQVEAAPPCARQFVPFVDGTGPAILVVCEGSVGIERDGQFTQLPGIFGFDVNTDAELRCGAVYDDGTGQAIYVGGFFDLVDGNPRKNIARWDGASWTAVAAGLNRVVSAMTVHDFGAGPVLVAGGRFTESGTQPLGRVAAWDGTAWSVVGAAPPDGPVRTLATWNDGMTSRLVAGGRFATAGGQSCNSLASFGLGVWGALGSGVNTAGTGDDGGLHTLFAFGEGGLGETLLIGGRFSAVDGVSANSAARLKDGTWSDMGQNLSPVDTHVDVFAFDEYEFPDGQALVIGGEFFVGSNRRRGMARRDANTWVPFLEEEIPVRTLRDGVVWDDGQESMFYVAARFGSQPNGLPASHVARRRTGGLWEDVGAGLDGSVWAIAAHDGPLRGSPADASGVYAIGYFDSTVHGGAANVSLPFAARFDGTSWQPLGAGLDVVSVTLHRSADWDLEVFDDGSGPRLFAVGGIAAITATGNPTPKRIAVWDGTAWAPAPVPDLWQFVPSCLEVWDDGNGPALFVGGYGRLLTGEPAPLLRYDGSAFQPILDPFGQSGTSTPRATDLAVYDDGSGEKLWISGETFQAASVFTDGGLATWDGTVLAGRDTAFDTGGRALVVAANGPGTESLLLSGSGPSPGSTLRGVLELESGRMDSMNWAPTVLLRGPSSEGAGSSVYVGGSSIVRVESLVVDGFAERQRFCDSGEAYCFGEGTTVPGCTPCPCGNDAPLGSRGGCLNVSGKGTRLVASGNPSVANDTLRFEVRGMTQLTLGVLFSGENRLPGNPANPCFGMDTGIADANATDGLRCMGGATTRRHGGRGSNADGAIGVTTPGWGLGNGPPGGLISFAGFVAGQTRHFQVFHRDAVSGGCGTGVNTSQGVTIQFLP